MEDPVRHAPLKQGEPQQRCEPRAHLQMRPLPRGAKDGLREQIEKPARHRHVLREVESILYSEGKHPSRAVVQLGTGGQAPAAGAHSASAAGTSRRGGHAPASPRIKCPRGGRGAWAPGPAPARPLHHRASLTRHAGMRWACPAATGAAEWAGGPQPRRPRYGVAAGVWLEEGRRPGAPPRRPAAPLLFLELLLLLLLLLRLAAKRQPRPQGGREREARQVPIGRVGRRAGEEGGSAAEYGRTKVAAPAAHHHRFRHDEHDGREILH